MNNNESFKVRREVDWALSYQIVELINVWRFGRVPIVYPTSPRLHLAKVNHFPGQCFWTSLVRALIYKDSIQQIMNNETNSKRFSLSQFFNYFTLCTSRFIKQNNFSLGRNAEYINIWIMKEISKKIFGLYG